MSCERVPAGCHLRSRSRRHLEANRGEETVEVIDDALLEPVELMPLCVLEAALAGLIDEGNQLSRMTHSLIQRVGASIEPRPL